MHIIAHKSYCWVENSTYRLTPIPEIIKQTNYTRQQLDCWSLRKFNVKIGKLYRIKLSQKLKDELLEYRKNGTPLKEIGNTYGHGVLWVKSRYRDLGLDSVRQRNNELMSKHVPWMLDAGYSLKKKKEELNICIATIKNWIIKNIGCKPSEYRKTHNITIKTWENN